MENFPQALVNDVQQALAGVPHVRRCIVLPRRPLGRDETELVAYVAPRSRTSRPQLLQDLGAAVAKSPLRVHLVLVSNLPVAPDGSLDAVQLAAMPVLDWETVEECRLALLDIEGVSAAAAIVTEANPPQPRLHLDDLLPRPLRMHGSEGEQAPSIRVGESALTAVLEQPVEAGPPAICSGPPLMGEPLTNLQSVLARAVRIAPRNTLTAMQSDGTWRVRTFEELAADAERISGSLRSAGVPALSKVVIHCENNADILVSFWGCLLGGYTPVPVAAAVTYEQPSAASEKLLNVWRALGDVPVIVNRLRKDDVERWSVREKAHGMRCLVYEDLLAGERDTCWHQNQPGELGIILFTSGSTGQPKGVMQPHGNLAASCVATAQMTGLGPQDSCLNWFPLDHVGGIIMYHLHWVYVGASQWHVPSDLILRDPVRWFDMMHEHRVTGTWAPNFAFALINEHEADVRQRQWDLSHIRMISNGGEAIVARTARKFLALMSSFGLKREVMRPAWGMSETCSAVTLDRGIHPDCDDAPFVEVGDLMPGISMRVLRPSGELASEGEAGTLEVKGSTVTPGYFNNPKVNAESFTFDGWFRTGDLAILKNGRLTITGRTKDVFIVNGVNFYSHEVESLVEQLPGIAASFTAICGVRPSGVETDKLCVFFHPSQGTNTACLPALLQTVRQQIARKTGANPDYLVPVEPEEIPKSSIGKILRAQLKQRFEAGEFAPHLRRVDMLTGAPNTLPAWFYTPAWVESPLPFGQGSLPSHCLVFAHAGDFSNTLTEHLRAAGIECTIIRPADGFSEIGLTEWTVDPRDHDSYRLVFAKVAEARKHPDLILHAWAYGAADSDITSVENLRAAQHLGSFSLLLALQAASQAGLAAPRVLAVTKGTQPVHDNGRRRPEHASMLGLVRTLAAEENVRCQLVDCEGETGQEDASLVWAELCAPDRASSTEAAYRAGIRHTATVKPVSFDAAALRDVPFRASGLYLLTGGLGGIGTHIAKLLQERFGARVALLGRSVLPPRNQWNAAIEADSPMAAKLRNALELEKSGAFQYLCADVSNSEALQSALESLERSHGRPVDGIIHLAAVEKLQSQLEVIDQHRVFRESVAQFEFSFSAKAYGLCNLYKLVRHRPDTVVVVSSSVNSLFSSPGLGAYCAAGSLVDALAASMQTRSHRNTFTVNWSMWDGIGMTAGTSGFVREMSRERGFDVLAPNQAVNSLLAALRTPVHQVLIGVNGQSPAFREVASGHAFPLETVEVFCEAANATAAVRAAINPFQDRFGSALYPVIHVVDRVPVVDGVVDLAALRAQSSTGGDTRRREPETAYEREVAELWCELLDVPQCYLDDRFFEIGGDSLLAIRLLNRVESKFGCRLPLQVLFEDPTVATMAAQIGRMKFEAPAAVALPTTEPETLLENLQSLSESEIDKLLARMAAGQN